ncbi:hypothetical protein HY469_04635 [Candidatus Roizmanbacteria bacterium]|nr:hypothetical protein [Candidatus Roizmanbacteria bacterium]
MPEKEKSPIEQTVKQNAPATPAEPVKKSTAKPLLLMIGIGLLIAAAVIAYLMMPKQQDTAPVVVAPMEEPEEEISLTLESPADDALAVEDEVLVRGTTTPGATIAVFTETDEIIVESDENGHFETTVQLVQGINTLTVTAYSSEGQEKSITRTIVYDEEV